jgi:predicted permease
MLRDLRLAARMLLQARGWTGVVVISLALGIGANTALFGAINGLLLRTIPVKDPHTLVRLRSVGKNQMAVSTSDYGYTAQIDARNMLTTFSYPMYQQFVADNKTMTDVFACAPYGRVNMVVDGRADIATAFISTGNYYTVLGVGARLGRTLLPSDDQPSAPPVGVISHKYWSSRFGGDPGAIGKSVLVNNVPITIVGVLPPEFTGVQLPIADPSDLSLPLALEPQLDAPQPRLGMATWWWLEVMGRLKPGATAAQVQGNLGGVFQATARAGLVAYLAELTPEQRARSAHQNRKDVPELIVESGAKGVYDADSRDIRAVSVLSAVVVLVLLIVCANVANLLLSRAATRQKELSVRLALGATRARLVRQLLTESLLLAAIGGAAGVLVGRWGQQLLPGRPGQAVPLDWRLMAFVIAITTITGVVFGIAPALRATSGDVHTALKETGRSVIGSRSLLGKSLLIAQVAISLVLLIGAGLFLRTLQNLRKVDVGFNASNVVLFRVNPSMNRYTPERQNQLYAQLNDRLRTVAGIRTVSWSNPALLSGNTNGTGFYVQGRTYAPDTPRPGILRVTVSPSFFETMEIPIVSGRNFTPRDTTGAPLVGIINEAAARKYFPNESPLGRRFGSSPEDSGKIEIVGILHDTKYNSVRDDVPATMFVPILQNVQGGAVFEVRTAGDPIGAINSIREGVRQVDSSLPMMDVSTQLEQVEKRFLQEKVFAQAYAWFGGLALLVASIGLFGLMSYSVARRTNEIGIRMALGAQREDVLALVMRESMILVAAGIAIGVVVAVAASRLVATLLFGLTPTDAPTMAVALVAMVSVSALAGFLPARRASRVDPMVALHYE